MHISDGPGFSQGERQAPPDPKRLRVGSQLVLSAQSLDTAGYGIAKTATGTVVRVQGLLSGESAEVEITAKRHGGTGSVRGPRSGTVAADVEMGPEFFARIRRRHTASSERVTPSCGGYGRCGGCVLQHLSYDAQLLRKHQLVEAELTAAGLSCDVDPIVPSPSPLGYRSRVKLVAASAAQPEPGDVVQPGIVSHLGAYAPRSHDVIDMAGCRTNEPALQALAQKLRAVTTRLGISAYDEALGRGVLRYVLLRSVASGALQLSLVHADALPEPLLTELLTSLLSVEPRLASVVLHRNQSRGNALLASELDEVSDDEATADRTLHGEPYLIEELGPVKVRLSSRSFSQVNREVAVAIYRLAAQEALASLKTHQTTTPRQILDLYCGVGGLGLTILAMSEDEQLSLTGIESSKSAVADAQAAAALAGLPVSRARFVAADVEAELPALLQQNPAVVVVNPPRRGLASGVLSALLENPPPCLVYVSCSPQSLFRDARGLCAAGYRTTRITPFDMHPGTSHVETLAVFQRPST